MTQAPRRFVVHRQAAKPKKNRSYMQETFRSRRKSQGKQLPAQASARPPCHNEQVLSMPFRTPFHYCDMLFVLYEYSCYKNVIDFAKWYNLE
jgi:hypothetical protein